MIVTPVNRKFGRYVPGDTFRLPDAVAKVFIKKGRLEEVKAATSKPQTYITRDMRPAPTPVAVVEAHEPEVVEESASEESRAEEAPYGYKADGTPRKRPGRPAASE